MCTVTFVPQKGQGFILTSNRDEQASRSPENITKTTLYDQQMLFPRDTEAGGTWIAVSDQNKVVCLLNGAFDLHRRTPPYRKSRGIMVLESFEYDSLQEFAENYDFENLEPFTFVLIDNGTLAELRWDGTKKHYKKLDNRQMHIWSSATLYDAETRKRREVWFEDWKKTHENYNLSSILDFHKNAGDGDPWNDVIMNRLGMVQTVSITNVINDQKGIAMHYHDLVNQAIKKAKINLEGEVVESS
ncbi:MAG: NRDE family protein [Bacteroidota bacterium]